MKTPEEILDERIRNIPNKWKNNRSMFCNNKMHISCMDRKDESGISFLSQKDRSACMCLCHLYYHSYINGKLQEAIDNIEPKVGILH